MRMTADTAGAFAAHGTFGKFPRASTLRDSRDFAAGDQQKLPLGLTKKGQAGMSVAKASPEALCQIEEQTAAPAPQIE